ncbi:MAG: hypothetical protein U5R48_18940 [Gammaproteobacteria bacterium]|nr:hypothetical protein [Gammaproteobacteria bacterium]
MRWRWKATNEIKNASVLSQSEHVAIVAPSFDGGLVEFAEAVAVFARRVILICEDHGTCADQQAEHEEGLPADVDLEFTSDFSPSFLASASERIPGFLELTRAIVVGKDVTHEEGQAGIPLYQVNPDDWAMCAAMAFRGFEPLNSDGRRLHIVMEMRRSENLLLCGDLGIDQAVPTERLIRLLTKQMTFYGGLVSEFLMKLLDYRASNPVGVLRKVPVAWLSRGDTPGNRRHRRSLGNRGSRLPVHACCWRCRSSGEICA